MPKKKNPFIKLFEQFKELPAEKQQTFFNTLEVGIANLINENEKDEQLKKFCLDVRGLFKSVIEQ